MKMNSYVRQTAVLAFLGAVPFFIGLVFLLLHFLSTQTLHFALGSYALFILSFLCGSHWGTGLSQNDEALSYLPTLTNLIGLCAWTAYLTLSFSWLLLCDGLLFFIVLLVDLILYRHKRIPASYFTMRCCVSFLVICACIALGMV
jgi:glucan phosphoethanolaminetransferase (alkaline phosphatase superfamily)